MASKRAGVITVDFEARSTKLESEVTQANAKLGRFGAAGKSAGKEIAGGMAVATVSTHKLGDELEKTSRALSHYAGSVVHGAEAMAAYAASHAAATKTLAKFTSEASGSVSTVDQLANAFRALRFAWSPTPFTAATIAAGVLAEGTIRLVNARAKLIQQQSLFAAANSLSFKSVDSIDTASRISGKNPASVRQVFTTLQSRDEQSVRSGMSKLGVSGSISDPATLGKIAAGFEAVQDPAKKAEIAVEIFGDSAGKALEELDSKFANGIGAVQRYGLAMDELSRTQIHQFRQEFINLKNDITDLSDLSGRWESIKQGTEIVAAAMEAMTKRGLHSLDDLISKYIPGMAALRASMHGEDKIPADASAPAQKGINDTNLRIQADELHAQAWFQRAEFSQTLPGQREARDQAESRRDDAYKRLQADQKKREANPNDATLLSGSEKFRLAVEERSAEAVLVATRAKVKAMEDEEQAAKDAAKAAEEIAKILKKTFLTAERDLTKAAGEFAASGKSPEERAQIDIKSAGTNAVARANEELSTRADGAKLSKSDEAKVRLPAESAEFLKQEAKFRDEVKATTQAIRDRISTQMILNAAIGAGFEAELSANVEAQLREKFKGDYTAPGATGKRSAAVETDRSLLTESGRLKNAGDIDNSLKSTQQQIDLETRLTSVNKLNTEAVELATLQLKIEQLQKEKGTEATKTLTDAMQKEFNLRKANLNTVQLQQLDLEIDATRRLTAAELEGADAVRKAELENAVARLKAMGATPAVIAKTITADDAKEQERIAAAAIQTGIAYKNRVTDIEKEIAYLKQGSSQLSDRLAVELSLKALEKERLEILAQQDLASGRAMDGVHAFFKQMQAEGIDTGKIINDSLHKSVDGLADSLSRVMTGQKGAFGKLLKDIGQSAVRESMKQAEAEGLKALAKRFPKLGGAIGQPKPGTGTASSPAGSAGTTPVGKVPGSGPGGVAGPSARRDGQTAATAYFVELAGISGPGPSSAPSSGQFDPMASIAGAAPIGFMNQKRAAQKESVSSKFLTGALDLGMMAAGGYLGSSGLLSAGVKGLGGLFGSTPSESVDSSISFGGYMADGGPVTPDTSYMVGEKGPEPFIPKTAGTIIPTKDFGATTHNYFTNVSAGVDMQTVEAAVRRGSQAAYQSSVQHSAQLADERKRRTPQ